MKKFLIIIISLFLIPSKVYAADYQVFCDAPGCTGPTNATFYEDNLSPGDSITRTIEVKSAYGQTLNLSLSAGKLTNTDDDLLTQIQITVVGLHGRTRFTDTLEQFFNTTSVDIGHLFAYGTKEVSLTATLAQFDNTYQAKKAWFNLPVAITVQGQAHDQGNGQTSSSQLPATQELPVSLPTSLISFFGQVEGLATPSAKGVITPEDLPPQLFKQLKNYLRLWPWPLLLLPFLWWFFRLLLKRQKR